MKKRALFIALSIVFFATFSVFANKKAKYHKAQRYYAYYCGKGKAKRRQHLCRALNGLLRMCQQNSVTPRRCHYALRRLVRKAYRRYYRRRKALPKDVQELFKKLNGHLARCNQPVWKQKSWRRRYRKWNRGGLQKKIQEYEWAEKFCPTKCLCRTQPSMTQLLQCPRLRVDVRGSTTDKRLYITNFKETMWKGVFPECFKKAQKILYTSFGKLAFEASLKKFSADVGQYLVSLKAPAKKDDIQRQVHTLAPKQVFVCHGLAYHKELPKRTTFQRMEELQRTSMLESIARHRRSVCMWHVRRIFPGSRIIAGYNTVLTHPTLRHERGYWLGIQSLQLTATHKLQIRLTLQTTKTEQQLRKQWERKKKEFDALFKRAEKLMDLKRLQKLRKELDTLKKRLNKLQKRVDENL